MRGLALSIFFILGYTGAYIVAALMSRAIHDDLSMHVITDGSNPFLLVGTLYGGLWMWYLEHGRGKR